MALIGCGLIDLAIGYLSTAIDDYECSLSFIDGILSANFKGVWDIKRMLDSQPSAAVHKLSQLLSETEQRLKHFGLWSQVQPSAQALASQQPFSLDTLSPEAWLQWVFIPKMAQAIASQTVPAGVVISPYFEQVWQGQTDRLAIISLLQAIDSECA
jgi:uncharacterized protein YqcC (DUF446 family)